MLIRMLMWVVTVVTIDAAHTRTSLSRFTACPRQRQLYPLIRVLGYLKKRPNRRIVIDSWDPIYRGGKDSLKMYYIKELKDQYPEAHKKVGMNAPSLLVDAR
jgi:hypothetical protein